MNTLFALSGHMVQNKLCWDANNAVRLSKQRKVGLDGTAEKPLIGWKIRCLGACSSAFRWQFAGASFENVWTFCKREHRKARIILDFCPDGTSTCRREWGLSKGKYVWNVSLVLSLSSSVIPYVIISFVGWCRFHNFRAEHGERKHLLCLFTIHLLLQILMYRWLNTMNTP